MASNLVFMVINDAVSAMEDGISTVMGNSTMGNIGNGADSDFDGDFSVTANTNGNIMGSAVGIHGNSIRGINGIHIHISININLMA